MQWGWYLGYLCQKEQREPYSCTACTFVVWIDLYCLTPIHVSATSGNEPLQLMSLVCLSKHILQGNLCITQQIIYPCETIQLYLTKSQQSTLMGCWFNVLSTDFCGAYHASITSQVQNWPRTIAACHPCLPLSPLFPGSNSTKNVIKK